MILLSLFLLPSLSASGGGLALGIDLRVLVATTIRNLAFSLLVIYLADLRNERNPLFGTSSRSVSRFATAAVIAVVLFSVSTVVGVIAARLPATAPEIGRIIPELAERHPPWLWIPVIVLSMLSVGFVEELLFRAYLMHRLRQLGLSATGTIILAAGFFALGHSYQGVAAIVFALIAGIILGFLWLRRGALIPFALGHAAYNLAALLISASGTDIF